MGQSRAHPEGRVCLTGRSRAGRSSWGHSSLAPGAAWTASPCGWGQGTPEMGLEGSWERPARTLEKELPCRSAGWTETGQGDPCWEGTQAAVGTPERDQRERTPGAGGRVATRGTNGSRWGQGQDGCPKRSNASQCPLPHTAVHGGHQSHSSPGLPRDQATPPRPLLGEAHLVP